MATSRDSWIEIFRALGQAFLDVVRAEVDLLAEQWKRWGAKAAIAAGLTALALVLVLIYLPGLLIFALIEGLHSTTELSLWGATLLVAVLITVLAMLLAGAGFLIVRSEKQPFAAAKGRFDDHLDWWRSKMLEGPAELEGGAPKEGADDETQSDG